MKQKVITIGYTLILITTVFVIFYFFFNHMKSQIYFDTWYNQIKQKKVAALILGLMGIGFIYQAFFSSNKEIQFNKVFWHDTRITHGLLYLISIYYLFENNIDMNSVVLSLDIVFSLIYRFYFKK